MKRQPTGESDAVETRRFPIADVVVQHLGPIMVLMPQNEAAVEYLTEIIKNEGCPLLAVAVRGTEGRRIEKDMQGDGLTSQRMPPLGTLTRPPRKPR